VSTWKWSILFWVGALLRGYMGARDFTRVLGLQPSSPPSRTRSVAGLVEGQQPTKGKPTGTSA
jgi:hypothetical protein